MPATKPNFEIIQPSKKSTNNNDIDKTIGITLRSLGVSPRHKGYYYLKIALKMCYENPTDYNIFITKRLYPDIAAMYKIKPAGVERAIRYAISDIVCEDSIKEEIIGYVSDRYSNGEFIACVLEYLKCL